MISRRDILEAAGVAGGYFLAGAGIMTVTKVASCTFEGEPEAVAVSPQERVEAAVAELTAALEAAHPGVKFDFAKYRPDRPERFYFGMLAFDGGADAAV